MTSRAALARHPLAIAGAVITTVSAVLFIALVIAVLAGFLNNPYAGLIVFVALPALFVFGLLLIPWGMRLQARKILTDPAAAAEWGVVDFRSATVRRTALIIIALTAVNLVILLVAGYGTLHWMESPAFCGQTCHTPMHVQFKAWQAAPHSNIRCTDCHIGEGARAMVHYKLVGVRQLYHVITNQVPKPIPGVADMRPALEICGNCHWPGKGFGDRVRAVREYADDEANTETLTLMRMNVGGAGQPSIAGRSIHWHADPRINITYIATDELRQKIPWVSVTDANGQVREFVAEGTTPDQLATGTRRRMDCIDCHNSVAHKIAGSAERAVDEAIAAGQISRALPFVRREGLQLLKAEYAAQQDGLQAIDAGLRKFYTGLGSAVPARDLDQAVETMRTLFSRNVFPDMKVTWGVYPDNIGHTTSDGCFRCHGGTHKAKDGAIISDDCEYCHKDIEAPAPPAKLTARLPPALPLALATSRAR